MPMQRFAVALALVLLTLGGALSADQFVHPDLKDGKVLVHSVLILPPGAFVKRFGNVLGGEVMPDETKQLQDSLRPSAGKVLVGKGCQSLEDPFTQEALDKSPDAKSALSEVEVRYQSVEPQMWKRPKDVRLGRFTLGDGVSKLNPRHTIDAFVFMGAFGSLATKSEKVRRKLLGPGNASQDAVDIQLSVVDARTGAVLYFGKKITSGNFLTDPQLVERGLEAVLEDFSCGPHPTP